MQIRKAIDSISTSLELRRIASAYVIDYRNLSDDALKVALKKTAPQYYYENNIRAALAEVFSNNSRQHRLISRWLIKEVLLNRDEWMMPKQEVEDEVIGFEQSIIDRSNEDLIQKTSPRSEHLGLFQFVVETAWDHNDDISIDEKNLLEKLQERLKVTEREHRIIEAKLGKFPREGNLVHTRTEIEETRRLLQSKGLLFLIRNTDGTDFDLIPDETAKVLRTVLRVEIKSHGYRELISQKYVRNKAYYVETLKKCGIETERGATVDELQAVIMEQVPPSILLGGVSPRDGLEISAFRKWCAELNLPVSGTKAEYVSRIIEFYDGLLEKSDTISDQRELWYEHFERFAARDLQFLRAQQLIEKDRDCEWRFEEATNYLFEKRLDHKPLKLVGSSHADGVLSYKDKVIYWDNKSKESPVHLKDHLKQFDGYIKAAERPVAGFWVIGPDFTPESELLAMQFTVECGATVTLIRADELKAIAEKWQSRKTDDPFPLGYMIQPGRLKTSLIAAL